MSTTLALVTGALLLLGAIPAVHGQANATNATTTTNATTCLSNNSVTLVPSATGFSLTPLTTGNGTRLRSCSLAVVDGNSVNVSDLGCFVAEACTADNNTLNATSPCYAVTPNCFTLNSTANSTALNVTQCYTFSPCSIYSADVCSSTNSVTLVNSSTGFSLTPINGTGNGTYFRSCSLAFINGSRTNISNLGCVVAEACSVTNGTSNNTANGTCYVMDHNCTTNATGNSTANATHQCYSYAPCSAFNATSNTTNTTTNTTTNATTCSANNSVTLQPSATGFSLTPLTTGNGTRLRSCSLAVVNGSSVNVSALGCFVAEACTANNNTLNTTSPCYAITPNCFTLNGTANSTALNVTQCYTFAPCSVFTNNNTNTTNHTTTNIITCTNNNNTVTLVPASTGFSLAPLTTTGNGTRLRLCSVAVNGSSVNISNLGCVALEPCTFVNTSTNSTTNATNNGICYAITPNCTMNATGNNTNATRQCYSFSPCSVFNATNNTTNATTTVAPATTIAPATTASITTTTQTQTTTTTMTAFTSATVTTTATTSTTRTTTTTTTRPTTSTTTITTITTTTTTTTATTPIIIETTIATTTNESCAINGVTLMPTDTGMSFTRLSSGNGTTFRFCNRDNNITDDDNTTSLLLRFLNGSLDLGCIEMIPCTATNDTDTNTTELLRTLNISIPCFTIDHNCSVNETNTTGEFGQCFSTAPCTTTTTTATPTATTTQPDECDKKAFAFVASNTGILLERLTEGKGVGFQGCANSVDPVNHTTGTCVVFTLCTAENSSSPCYRMRNCVSALDECLKAVACESASVTTTAPSSTRTRRTRTTRSTRAHTSRRHTSPHDDDDDSPRNNTTTTTTTTTVTTTTTTPATINPITATRPPPGGSSCGTGTNFRLLPDTSGVKYVEVQNGVLLVPCGATSGDPCFVMRSCVGAADGNDCLQEEACDASSNGQCFRKIAC